MNLNLIHCFRTCIMSFNLFMHHIAFVLYIFFVLTCSLTLVLFFFFLLSFCYVFFGPCSSTMPRETKANRVPSTPSMSPSRVQLLRTTVVVRLLRN